MCSILSIASHIFLCAILAAAQEGPVVQTVQGLLRGVPATDGDYNQFLGVRYGTIGPTNRFKVALPPPTWEGIQDANEDSVPCPQQSGLTSEDCLFLNIYVPNNATGINPLPVMVFFHGGGFNQGNGGSKTFGPQFIIRHEILLVVINYRLGPFGFICLGTEEIPGNAGLKDMVYALRWVRDNIAAFGGDPDNVTIFGNSAGGMSVDYLLISPMASGLFHKAIAQSGSALAPSILQRHAVENAFTIGAQLGITTTDVYQLQEGLLNMSAALILETEASQTHDFFTPCIETAIEGTESIITHSPYSIISSGNYNHIPYMTGFNDKEGLLELNMYVRQHALETLVDHLKDFLPTDLTFTNEAMRNQVLRRIYQFYFDQDDVNVYKTEEIVDFFSDYMFTSPADRTVRLRLQNSNQPIYSYEFRYVGELTQANSFNVRGASHTDEVKYQFTSNGTILNINAKDQLMIDRMAILWTNFAKYGNPTPEINEILPVNWLPVTADSLNYLILDHSLALSQDPISERLAFWKDLYEQYFVETFVTDNAGILSPRFWTFLVIAGTSVLIQFIKQFKV